MTIDQITPVIIGGLVTLAVTFVVQVFVVPRVQASTRRRERWEKNVLEISALLEEELPRAISGYRAADYQIRYIKKWIGDKQYNKEKVQELWQSAKTELREADKVIGEQISRLMLLESRIRQLHPQAPYWGQLSVLLIKLRLAAMTIEITRLDEEPDPLDDDDRWNEAWEELWAAQKELLAKLTEIAGPMKLPSGQVVHRVQKWREVRRSKQAETRSPEVKSGDVG